MKQSEMAMYVASLVSLIKFECAEMTTAQKVDTCLERKRYAEEQKWPETAEAWAKAAKYFEAKLREESQGV